MIEMQTLLADLRHGLRLLRRSPGFTCVAVSALALGIGANTAIFSAVDAMILRPLALFEPDRLVMIWEDASRVGFPRNTPAPANFFDWKAQSTVFEDMAATRGRQTNLTGDGPPEEITGRGVMANFFKVIGVQPILGRVFTEQEDETGAPVALISYSLWQRRLGGDPNVVGRKISMNGAPITVLGVMPRDFTFPKREIDFWNPAAFTPRDRATRGSHYLQVIGRLKPGVTIEQARQEMDAISARLLKQYPYSSPGAVLVPLKEQILGDTRLALWMLLGAAGCVLLIACANLANLLLARASGRTREMAVRSALGAGRGRLVRQMVTESIVVSLLGGILGMALAYGGVRLLRGMVPMGLPASAAPSIDARVLFFALGLSLITGIAFSLVPSIQLASKGLSESLKEGGRGDIGRRGWLRDFLIVSEVAVALVLLVGAGLMIRTLASLQSIDLGFRPDHLLTASTSLSRAKYRDNSTRLPFYDRVLDKVRAMPGVENAAFGYTLPLTSIGNTSSYEVEGFPDQRDDVLYRMGTHDYLKTLGVRLKEGRLYDSRDRADSQPVVVINDTFARRFWPNESALGKRISVAQTNGLAVIGVVEDIRERGLLPAMKIGAYLLIDQNPQTWAVPDELIIRTKGDPALIANAVRQAVWSVDPEQPVARLRSMDEIVELQVANRRQQMTLLAAFAALALILASVGLYGVLSYMVTQRTREIGVRMALGASRGDVVRMVVRRGGALAAVGLAVGLGASWAATRLLEKLLFGVKPTDGSTYAVVSIVLAAVALVACWVPARRAAMLDPAAVLRQE